MKNTDLILFRIKIQVCILMKNTDLIFIIMKKNEAFIINFL